MSVATPPDVGRVGIGGSGCEPRNLGYTNPGAREICGVVAAAADGANWAWSELVRRYSGMIGSITRGYRLTPSDGAEVAQATWLRLVQNIDKLNSPDRIGSWLATTTRRECQRVVRASQRSQPTPPESFDRFGDSGLGHPEPAHLVAERDVALRIAFSRLSPRCRMLLVLLIGEPSLSYRTLSHVLGMQIGSIGPTRGRCLEQLRRLAIECGVILDDERRRRHGADAGGSTEVASIPA